MLARIAMGEGTSDDKARQHNFASGYDVPLAYGVLGLPKKPLSAMTVDEVNQYQRQMLHNPGNRWNSSALGKYQITLTTMKDLRRQLGLKGDEVFTPELQDRMAMALLKRRGLDNYRAGKIGADEFQQRLAYEWASVAAPKSGKSAYGQATGTSTGAIQSVIAGLRH